ncbi:hypothetical protein LIS83_05385 [Bacillus anthracis]|uniref:hypothetical protein n=1 Tax=Bacillus anthracis TaxID=1392 RepID=UPI0020799908|nr:hypothetical protein [Bacillus anthracis]USL05157.1 hypothetical protein LIS83_05385 [Bacillus anthracis]
MIAMFVIKLVYGILTGAGVVIGRRYVGPWLISVYKKARTTLLFVEKVELDPKS